MRHLIVGAGATFAEARALGNPLEICPPLIRDFARKTWANYTPHPFLEVYLQQLGYEDAGNDPRVLFFELEDKGTTNIERFMEFVWENRNANFKVSENPPPGYSLAFTSEKGEVWPSRRRLRSGMIYSSTELEIHSHSI